MPTVDGAHFVVKHIEADFLKSAKLGDMIEVKHKILHLGNASIKLKQSVWRDGLKLFDMTSVLVYAKNGKPMKIDETMKDFLKDLF